jgi:hypothetical protein
MPTECSQDSFEFGTVAGRRVVGAFDGGLITSDAGGLLLGATNKAIRLVERFAACFQDGRDAGQIEHTVATLELFLLAVNRIGHGGFPSGPQIRFG